MWIRKLSTKVPNGLNKNDWICKFVFLFIYLFIYIVKTYLKHR
jgi:hypothetical protein